MKIKGIINPSHEQDCSFQSMQRKNYPDRKGFKAPEQITEGNLSRWFLWRSLKGKKSIFYSWCRRNLGGGMWLKLLAVEGLSLLLLKVLCKGDVFVMLELEKIFESSASLLVEEMHIKNKMKHYDLLTRISVIETTANTRVWLESEVTRLLLIVAKV